LSDEKTIALQELHDLIVRNIAMHDTLEAMEHRIATIVEGGRQQLSHLVADLRLPDMRAELRDISAGLKRIEKKL
jgi:hypothetical protein